MSMRTAWLLWALILALSIAVPVLAQGDQPLRCNATDCIVPRARLLELMHAEARAEDYATMCGWAQR